MLADLLTSEHHSSSEVPTLNCLFSVSLLHALFGQTIVAFPFPFLRPIDFSSVSPRRAGKPTDLAGTMWKVEGRRNETAFCSYGCQISVRVCVDVVDNS